MNFIESKNIERTYEGIKLSSEFMDGSSKVFVNGLHSFSDHLHKLQSALMSLHASPAAKNTKFFGSGVKDKMSPLEVNGIFAKNYDSLNFINISSVIITTPAGLNSYMLPYGIGLKSIYSNTHLLMLEFLKYTSVILSGYVTNKKSRVSTILDFTDVNVARDKRADNLKMYSDFFNTKSDGGKSTIGEAFQNKHEIIDSVVVSFELSVLLYKTTNFSLITNLIDEVNDLNSLLEKSILSEGAEFRPSNQVIKLISDTLYVCGSILDFFGVVYYAGEIYIDTIEKVIAKIK